MFERGSEWRKWDLHVHTPVSIEQDFGGPEKWDEYIADLEDLPSDFAVVGINDYCFLDGYQKVLEYRGAGRLKNLALVLPVVELRLRIMAGVGKAKRVNLHVIFSDHLTTSQIEQEFLQNLQIEATLPAGTFKRSLTRENLAAFGDEYKRHVDQAAPGGLKTGFHQFNVDLQAVVDILNTRDVLRGRYLLAVGRSEWDSIQYDGAGGIERSTILNTVDFMFTAAHTDAKFQEARKSLGSQGRDRLIHASDAHRLSTNSRPDMKIGQGRTWIKADCTFEGLVLAAKGFGQRVFTGTTPPQLENLATHPTRFMRSIAITHDDPSAGEWFGSTALPLNPGLIAIIGNKGSGKSALSDVLALCGDTKINDFSFLRADRFLNRKTGAATKFSGTIDWRAGPRTTKRLSDVADSTEPERVRYLPQQHFETLCAEVGDSADSRFEQELRRVVFTWLPDEIRGTATDLDSLIEAQTHAWRERNRLLLGELQELNRQIAGIEREVQPESVKELRNRLRDRKADLEAHRLARPVASPEDVSAAVSDDPTIPRAADRLAEIDARDTPLAAETASADTRIADASAAVLMARDMVDRLQNLQLYVDQQFRSEDATRRLEALGLSEGDLLTIEIDHERAAEVLQRAQLDQQRAQQERADVESDREALAVERAEIVAALDVRALERQEAVDALRNWTALELEIIGSPAVPDSVAFLEAAVAGVPDRHAALLTSEARRREKVSEIFENHERLRTFYADLFAPIDRYLTGNELLRERLRIEVRTEMRQTGFVHDLGTYFDQTKAGHFRQGGAASFEEDVNDTDFGSFAAVWELLSAVLVRARDNDPNRDVDRQMRGGRHREELYDWLFGLSYISTGYTLSLDGKAISQLSPGERGAVLLVFYLMVDRDNLPLIVDQPEENLDNLTVASLLVPALQEVRQHRQVVLVTHNPNLAVHCDADQIIVARAVRGTDIRLEYDSGSLENGTIRDAVVDILEGTQPAFDDRSDTYQVRR